MARTVRREEQEQQERHTGRHARVWLDREIKIRSGCAPAGAIWLKNDRGNIYGHRQPVIPGKCGRKGEVSMGIMKKYEASMPQTGTNRDGKGL